MFSLSMLTSPVEPPCEGAWAWESLRTEARWIPYGKLAGPQSLVTSLGTW